MAGEQTRSPRAHRAAVQVLHLDGGSLLRRLLRSGQSCGRGRAADGDPDGSPRTGILPAMAEENELDGARKIVDASLYMVIATADLSGQPWASPVYFAHRDYRDFF